MGHVHNKLWAALLVAIPLVLHGAAAQARSHHQSVTVKPLKKNGKVVGAKITMVLVNSDGYKEARVNLVDPEKRAAVTRPATFHKGSTAYAFDTLKLSGSKPEEVTFELKYGDGNKFQGGEYLDVVSGWRSNTVNDPHVWGAVTGNGRPAGHKGDIRLPKSG